MHCQLKYVCRIHKRFISQARAYIEEARQIRKEQDEAYQQSLKADKAKDKPKAEREQLQDV